MDDETPHQTQIYLSTPGRCAVESFPDLLAELLDSVPVACVRLALDTRDEEIIAGMADVLRSICHTRDVALVIAEHYRIVRRLGLDGVHLMGTRDVRAARDELAEGSIVGTFCGSSRHAGMTAGEMGADYISFGPMVIGDLGSGEIVDMEHFKWWSEMIEIPSVAEGGVTLETAKALSQYADFICLGDEIWLGADTPQSNLKAFATAIA